MQELKKAVLFLFYRIPNFFTSTTTVLIRITKTHFPNSSSCKFNTIHIICITKTNTSLNHKHNSTIGFYAFVITVESPQLTIPRFFIYTSLFYSIQ